MMTPEQWADQIIDKCDQIEYHTSENQILIAGVIRAAIAEVTPRWIPVGEGLPEPGDAVLTIDCDQRQHIGYRAAGAWWDRDGRGSRLDGITHWQPLPPPPVEVQ